MVTKKWLIYDKAVNPHWYFPEGIYVEQFDTTFNKQASIKADTAWYFTQKKLWQLKDNVFMKNIKEETFSTSELFWDEKTQEIYSNKYIEIFKPDELTLKGYGFKSNTEMTQYKVFYPFDSPIHLKDEQNPSPTPHSQTAPQKKDSVPASNQNQDKK